MSSVSGDKKGHLPVDLLFPGGEPPVGVHVEELGQFGDPKARLKDDCPLALDVMLDQKGALDVYDEFIQAVVSECYIRWLMLFDPQKIVALLRERGFAERFAAQGVKVCVCAQRLPQKDNFEYDWLEFVDLEAAPDYQSERDVALTAQQKKLMLPSGVHLQNLDPTKLLQEEQTPATGSLLELLETRGLVSLRSSLMEAIKQTVQSFRFTAPKLDYKDVLTTVSEQSFDQKFEEAGVKVLVCAEEASFVSSSKVWLEFVDLEKGPTHYASRYDASLLLNRRFVPEGVAVKELSRANTSQDEKRLEELLEKKGLQQQHYQQLEDDIGTCSTLTLDKILEVVERYESVFASNGIGLALCRSKGEFWIEFMDQETIDGTGYTPIYNVLNTNQIGQGMHIPPAGVAIEVLGSTNTLKQECPKALKLLLEKADARPEYDKFVDALTDNKHHAKDMWGYWQISSIQTILDEFQGEFHDKGIHVALCKSQWASGTNCWLEFIDLAVAPPTYVPIYGVQARRSVFDGRHFIPVAGVEIQELFVGGQAKLENECPPEVLELLERKSVAYEEIAKALGPLLPDPLTVKEMAAEQAISIVTDKIIQQDQGKEQMKEVGVEYASSLTGTTLTTKSIEERWKVAIVRMLYTLDELSTNLGLDTKGLKLALCERHAESANHYWLEYIDVTVAEDYVPSYNAGNLSTQILQTTKATVRFPKGVAVEELLEDGNGLAKCNELGSKVPPQVQEILDAKDLQQEYESLTTALCQCGIGPSAHWDCDKVQQIVQAMGPAFEAKGVTLCVSYKQERLKQKVDAQDLGKYEVGYWKGYQWVEFIDRTQQPNYVPQRGVHLKASKEGGIQMDEVVLVGSLAWSVGCIVLASMK
eukprot:Sro6_g005320.2  (871) ;mRNA; r:153909-156521